MKQSWYEPPTHPILSNTDLHIWSADLDLPKNNIRYLSKCLSMDEVKKAEQFHFERDKNRYIIARGTLRTILACYLNIEPAEMRFYYDENGKPELQNTFDNSGIRFNLAHSEELALYAFTHRHEVGIDLEYIREIPEMEKIVEQYFSEKEKNIFRTLSVNDKRRTFFNWWTLKEAFTKATGNDLSYSLDAFDITDSKQSSEWSIWGVSPAEEYVGAVAVAGRNLNVQYWHWPGYSEEYTEMIRAGSLSVRL